MDCTHALDNLSAYLDDALDPHTRADVEKHLSSCDRCRSELDALRACVRAVSSLERIPAPPGFLDKVHECIEPQSPWKRLLSILLLPWHIKVPLHLAGAGAMVLLILATMPARRFEQKPGKAVETLLFQAQKEKAVHDHAPRQMVEEKPFIQPAPLSNEKAHKAASSTETMPIQLVLLIPGEKTVPGREPPPGERDKGLSALRDTEGSARVEAVPLSPERSLSVPRPAHPELGGVTAGAQLKEKPTSVGRVALSRPADKGGNDKGKLHPLQADSKEAQALLSSSGPTAAAEVDKIAIRAASSLDQWIRGIHGTIHGIDYTNGKDGSCSILASIPAWSYQAFLEQLRVLGKLRDQPFEELPSGEDRPLLVNITLIPAD